CDSSRTREIEPPVETRKTPWPRDPNAPSEATNQRLPSGPEAIEVAIASSPIGNRESCPDGEIRSISERFAIQTLRSGPAAIPLGRKLRPGVRSPSDTTSAAAPETPTAQTWTFESAPNPTTHTRPSGPAEIAWPRAAAPATANSVTKPAVVIRATRPV